MDKGEDFIINWVSNQNNTSLNIDLDHPFLFNTPVPPKLVLTFLNKTQLL